LRIAFQNYEDSEQMPNLLTVENKNVNKFVTLHRSYFKLQNNYYANFMYLKFY